MTSYTLMIRVTDDGLGGVEARIPPTLFDQQTVTIFVSNEDDAPQIHQVTGGSSFGLGTTGGEPLTIFGRHFGSSRPGSLNDGLPWIASNGSQVNIQVLSGHINHDDALFVAVVADRVRLPVTSCVPVRC